jgi:hypothetical protein
VPLKLTTESWGDGCVGLYNVADVVADPSFGTVVKDGGWAVIWPEGYTGWSDGSQVEVRDERGKVVLTTGSRYQLAPLGLSYNDRKAPDWTIGCVSPCPDCELGVHLM